MFRCSVTFALATTFAGLALTEPAQPLDPASERASFRFADPQLIAELVAAEPHVSSPVALAWDARGRMFVAEMRDYPNSKEGGAIRQLEDHDADGKYETATVFADRLPFPNSVLPWNGGVLVTAAPDLWFLRDRDGDGVAEERRVLFTGFGTGNQQLRVNGLLWGLDGWVYGANGRSDGDLRRVYNPRDLGGSFRDSAPDPTKGVSLRGRDFRFRPDTGEVETLVGRSQFGHARDDWGNRFLSWNTIPLRHEVFPDHFLARHPQLAAFDVLQDCLPAGDRGEVFPLTPPPLVFNTESGSHFNALSGLHLFRGQALGSAYIGNAFVGESLRNLVHRRVLVSEGPTFRAERPDQGREFLASTDPWFHPVNFATGPDGALYVADFYRQFVEHPDWVAREMRDRVSWDMGREHGRIWRVRKRDGPWQPAGSRLALAKASAEALVQALADPNGWKRDTAQRLLVERNERAAGPALHVAARSAATPPARAAALQTLEVLGLLDEAFLLAVLRDPDPNVRAVAAGLTGRHLSHTRASAAESSAAIAPLTRSLTGLLQDSPDAVRLHAALALGLVAPGEERDSALRGMGMNSTNRWLILAAAAGATTLEAPWLAKLKPAPKLNRPPPAPPNPDPDRARVVEAFRPALLLTGDRTRGAVTCARLCLGCHYLQGEGQRVGPDLSGLATKPPETLLTDLLDPSRHVAPDYQAYELIATDDTRVTGLIASESETRLTVRQPGAPDVSLARSQLRELRSTGRSLMPDGLETGLSVGDLADLLAFLRAPDGSLIPK